ncbi:hypothetical protein ACQEWB_50220 [Streptomyces sp. CA-249302]|uniref:hypothetical protein n=1 Tax=Streptomyces sp. CA-249302 TaxID=3240058 RepID=UPI003D8F3E56
MDVIGTIDHEHRNVGVEVEQRTQPERWPALGQFGGGRLVFEAHGVAGDALHAVREGPARGERRLAGPTALSPAVNWRRHLTHVWGSRCSSHLSTSMCRSPINRSMNDMHGGLLNP